MCFGFLSLILHFYIFGIIIQFWRGWHAHCMCHLPVGFGVKVLHTNPFHCNLNGNCNVQATANGNMKSMLNSCDNDLGFNSLLPWATGWPVNNHFFFVKKIYRVHFYANKQLEMIAMEFWRLNIQLLMKW